MIVFHIVLFRKVEHAGFAFTLERFKFHRSTLKGGRKDTQSGTICSRAFPFPREPLVSLLAQAYSWALLLLLERIESTKEATVGRTIAFP